MNSGLQNLTEVWVLESGIHSAENGINSGLQHHTIKRITVPYLLISAAHKSSGKTTLTLGLCAALTARGLVVQPFKKGPDYIDPLWLSQAATRPCHNLDFQTMTPAEIVKTVRQYSYGADLSIIEGNKGLYDGLDVEGSNSNAALAQLLKVPVILVLDTRGTTRGIAPLILGYQAFDNQIQIAGVILNQVGGKRHESKLRAAIEHYTNMPVLGAVQRDPRLAIQERHLGLIPSNEEHQAQGTIKTIAELIAQQVNFEQLIEIANKVSGATHHPLLSSAAKGERTTEVNLADSEKTTTVTIGIIRDAAFGFYYPGDLLALETAGAKLLFISALHDSRLPEIDALFIGGGFPETHITTLANNQQLKEDIKTAIEQGMPVYAECGGLMYLSRQITWHDQTGAMVGALPCDTVMEDRPQGRGYVHLRETGNGLWPLLDQHGQPAEFHAHEFHYSKIINLPSHLLFAYQVLRGEGLDGHHDGLIYKNTLASYVHLRDVENNPWTQRFVNFVRYYKQAQI
jgi:cobyrinic acid a,c-diamide synthase